MNLLDSQRNAASAQLLLRLASEHGMPAAACLKGTRLSPEDLGQPDTLVTGHQELLIVDNLVRRLGQVPALGLASAGRGSRRRPIGGRPGNRPASRRLRRAAGT